jgi:putative flippase GtrA
LRVPDSTFLRFLVAGAINTLFGFLIYCGAILFGFYVWQALLAGMLLGIGFNFLTTGGYAFRDISVHRFIRFCAAYFLIYVINLALVILLKQWISNTIAIQAVMTIPMALGSYVLMAKFVFQRPFKVRNCSDTSRG